MGRSVLVLGGRGFLGQRTVEALRAIPGLEVEASTRALVDLTRPATFGALDRFDAVVDCADTVLAAPDDAVRHVVSRGGLFVESTSDVATNRRLLDAKLEGPGTLVLGAGLFPGVSNLLAAEAARRLGPGGCATLDHAVRFSPLLSGCGAGTVHMMVEVATIPATHVIDGQRVAGPPVAAGEPLPFRHGARRTLRVGFADTLLLHRSTGVPTVRGWVAPVPAFAWPFAVLSGLLPRVLLANPVSRALSRLALRLLRTVVLRGRPTDVELLARARGPGGESLLRLHVADGFRATAHGIAAVVSRALDVRPAPGLVGPDQVGPLDDVLARMRAQGCPPFELT